MTMNAKTLYRHLAGLSDPDESKRRGAALALAESDERAVYPLIRALRDENPGVQDAAINSLVALGGETVAYMVIPLLREDALVRNSALQILKALGRVSVSLLYPLLKDKDDDVRKFALDLMADIREDVIPERAAPLLEDPNANVRAAAVRAIGALGYREAVPALMKALGDEEWVCFAVLETLGDLADERPVPEILRLLDHPSLAIRLSAIETLGRIGSLSASDALRSHIGGDAPQDEKDAAVRSLVMIGVTPAMSEIGDLLLNMWTSGGWEERLVALRGLVDLRDARAIYTIADVTGSLDTSNPEHEEMWFEIKGMLKEFGCHEEFLNVLSCRMLRYRGRILIAEVLGDMACTGALPALAGLLGGEDRDVRRACLQAIGTLRTPEARAILLEHVKDYDSHNRKTAIAALGLQRVAEAFEPLAGAIPAEPYADVIEEAVKALLLIDPGRMLAMLGGMSVQIREDIGRLSTDLPTLLELSRDPEARVKLSALYGLGRVGGKGAEDRLIEAMKDADPEVRRTAVIALGGNICCYSEIKDLLQDQDMWVRLHAVRALGESLREEMLPVLAQMLRDRDVPVAVATVEAVATIGGPRAKDILDRAMHHRDDSVREAALTALERI